MKFSQVLLICTILIIAACTSESKHIEKTLERTTLQPFSDTVKLDTFKIRLNGNKTETMSLQFAIISFSGQKIYYKEIRARDLLKSYLASASLKSEEEKIKFLNEEIELFFDDEHFLVPAITDQEKPDENTPDKAFYTELKKSQYNGFGYRLGKDTKIYIAWSEKDKKVKTYYECCKVPIK